MSRYLVTGASGFLGGFLLNFVTSTKGEVFSVGRNSSNQIVADLAREIPVISQNIDVVVHAAGKAHTVPSTEAEKRDFFDVNLNGTKNLCTALEKLEIKPLSFIFISTVAVYGLDTGKNIPERHVLAGKTPYALSKIEAEKFLETWCATNHIKLSILRLPLIAGQRPPGNLGAMVKGIQSGKYFNISGGTAKKSIVMAADVAKWIPVIAQHPGIYNLTDGYHPSFSELANVIAKQLNKSTPKNIPGWIAKCIALVGNLLGNKAPINTDKLQKITATLTFDDTLARKTFGWAPSKVLDGFIID